MVLTGPPLAPSKLLLFLDFDVSTLHFLHNNALIIIMLIGNCEVSKILADEGSSMNILYGRALDRMEDTPELARAMINHQTQSHLHGFDGNEMRSPSIISFPVRADPYNVIMEFYVVDVESPIMRYSGDPGST